MSKSLLIVESPAKARTLKRYLGKGFNVEASLGHIKDLPKSDLGVDVEHGFSPMYSVIRGKSKVISTLKKAAKEADVIYLAPDPDREGEAIAWHIQEEIKSKKDQKPIYRVMITEITKKGVDAAIKKADKEKTPIDENMYNAQQARRILDRLVGYQISPILWRKVKSGLSAGRVQSVALRLVVEREEAIKAFVSEEYWSLEAKLEGKLPPQFVAKLDKVDGKKAQIPNGDQAKALESEAKAGQFILKSIERKEQRRYPAPPFITSTLQREAFRKLRLSTKQTMMIAQKLYEGVDVEGEPVGLITYMRTDSTRVSDDALTACRDYIKSNFGADYLPGKPTIFKVKKNAQDAHEAIRPTTMAYPPEKVRKFLTDEQFKLYKLVWDRFVACQMQPAIYDRTVFEIENKRMLFKASGAILKFKGFMSLYIEDTDEPDEENEDGNMLPDLKEGEALRLVESIPGQHFTQPPPRFNESTLVKELEDKGIGRPSTYAQILSTIRDKGYVDVQDRKFIPTDLGLLVNELLVANFPKIFETTFTADMEASLDAVESGERDWRELLAEFYDPFQKTLDYAAEHMENVRARAIPTDVVCDKCSEPMVLKWGKNGYFLSCSNYPTCKNAKGYAKNPDGTIVAAEGETIDEKCPKCESNLLVKQGRKGRFIACSNYPDCKFTKPIGTGVPCPGVNGPCEGELVEKQSKTGRTFYACNKWPECNYALWDRPIKRECPECGNSLLVENVSKQGAKIKCPVKGCKYREEPQ